jgi:hypothetical protein
MDVSVFTGCGAGYYSDYVAATMTFPGRRGDAGGVAGLLCRLFQVVG